MADRNKLRFTQQELEYAQADPFLRKLLEYRDVYPALASQARIRALYGDGNGPRATLIMANAGVPNQYVYCTIIRTSRIVGDEATQKATVINIAEALSLEGGPFFNNNRAKSAFIKAGHSFIERSANVPLSTSQAPVVPVETDSIRRPKGFVESGAISQKVEDAAKLGDTASERLKNLMTALRETRALVGAKILRRDAVKEGMVLGNVSKTELEAALERVGKLTRNKLRKLESGEERANEPELSIISKALSLNERELVLLTTAFAELYADKDKSHKPKEKDTNNSGKLPGVFSVKLKTLLENRVKAAKAAGKKVSNNDLYIALEGAEHSSALRSHHVESIKIEDVRMPKQQNFIDRAFEIVRGLVKLGWIQHEDAGEWKEAALEQAREMGIIIPASDVEGVQASKAQPASPANIGKGRK